MALRRGCVVQRALLIGDGGKESAGSLERLTDIILSQGKVHLTRGGACLNRVFDDIERQ